MQSKTEPIPIYMVFMKLHFTQFPSIFTRNPGCYHRRAEITICEHREREDSVPLSVLSLRHVYRIDLSLQE